MISEETTLVVIDIQEKLLPAIRKSASMLLNVKKSILAAKALKLPVICTEQYPKGLGHTVDELSVALKGVPVFEKTSFSCCGSEAFMNSLQSKKVLLVGIEAHVCVYQTACDLLAKGFEVVIAEDAVSSRQKLDCQRALLNLEKKGVFISTFESLFMNLLKDSKHPSFKEVSAILKM